MNEAMDMHADQSPLEALIDELDNLSIDANGRLNLALNTPLEDEDGNPVSVLVFRRDPCAGDLRDAKVQNLIAGKADDVLALLGRLCGLPLPRIRKLDLGDMATASLVIGCFFVPGRRTGKK
ncbi:phage tail assembly protein [Jeongeupia naejangsanensis]|uniref:Phage tail assembly protein n=1 Tax=Jeongeupia naejangsanensis TaxID=613195 RepID=A0ABS2BFQ0_9NEIS|nr:phage tail assembly protein [Jeongeupia naejangsanensis]MBM3114280.1 phage tail assembly protein [Jeongeupia naejangsanensis]